MANGTRIPFAGPSQSTPKTGAVSFNPLQGQLESVTSPNTCSIAHPCQLDNSGIAENAHTNTYANDLAGRASTQTYSDNSGNPRGTSWSKEYDVQNHLVLETLTDMPSGKYGAINFQLGYVIGPMERPFEIGSTAQSLQPTTNYGPFQYESLYWDDGTLLFTTNSSGAIDDVKIGDIADYIPGSAALLVMWDRDNNGQIAGCHSSAGSGFGQSTVWQSSATCSNISGVLFPGPIFPQPLITTYSPVGRGGLLGIPKSDGISDGQNTIQGVRSYDPGTGQWSTPDAYRGDVHDPMSQKPYMWDRNNPYAYEDPSGFDPDDSMELTGSRNNATSGKRWNAGKMLSRAMAALRRMPQHAADFRSGLEREHFQQHGLETGSRSAEEYVGKAKALYGSTDAKAKMDTKNGVLYIYDAKSGNIGMYNTSDGSIRSLFNPDNTGGSSAEYFDRQGGTSVPPPSKR